ncbi:MAG: dihydropteroate synthase [Dehalococcoidia bacterium]
MGILNITDDSFSGDGVGNDVEAAVARARRLVEEGADIIDVGGESTRPDSKPITAEEELNRVLPIIKKLSKEIDTPISIDTYKSEVARRALEAGANMINDVWGLRQDPELAGVAAKYGVPIVITANQRDTQYKDIMAAVVESLVIGMNKALDAGVAWENIIIDPGIGFGKTLEGNLEVLRRSNELKSLGRPILLGTSRKSMIGQVLDLPVDERLEGTAATVALGIANGADIIRVHDVLQMKRVARMTDAVVRGIVRGIKLSLKPVRVYLSLGSNLGNRRANLIKAIALLTQDGGKVSSVYETEPVGVGEQPRFLNMVIRIDTYMSPVQLLSLIKGIEAEMGRDLSLKNAPRVIDIDIILYGDTIMESPELTIPHPRMRERAFVLIPFAEIAPDVVHPATGERVGDLAARVEGRDGVVEVIKRSKLFPEVRHNV